jgi:hypothetical protein
MNTFGNIGVYVCVCVGGRGLCYKVSQKSLNQKHYYYYSRAAVLNLCETAAG